jgi:hypothetical protein
LEGWLSGLIFIALKGKNQSAKLYAYPVAALCTALLNTAFFVGLLLIFFWKTEFIQGIAATFGTTGVTAFTVALVGVNGAIEWVVCAVAGGAIARALRIDSKRSAI